MKVKDLAMASPTINARIDWEEYGYPQYGGDTEWVREYLEEFKRLVDKAIKADEVDWNAKS